LTTVLIIIGVVVVLAIIAALVMGKQAKTKRDESNRVEARGHREEAGIATARADSKEAAAEEKAARAKRAQAEADEHAALARRERESASERHEHADALDPDVDETADDYVPGQHATTDNHRGDDGVDRGGSVRDEERRT